MKLKDKPVYPILDMAGKGKMSEDDASGLTYLEWLIGMLASNPSVYNPMVSVKRLEELIEEANLKRQDTVKYITDELQKDRKFETALIAKADAIIKEMENE